MRLRMPTARLCLLAVLVMLALAPLNAVSAAQQGASRLILTSPLLQSPEPITLYTASTGLIATLDPQVAQDTASIQIIENLFLGLTDFDPQTNTIRPELATSWESNDAGDVWTFTLRADVPWVRYNPTTGETVEVRKVIAQDFVYGIRRGCDPRLGSYYSNIAASIIKGCAEVFNKEADQISTEDFEQIGVRALSDTQLEVTLQASLGFFLPASSMWIFRATPRETIEEFGDQWTEPGNIVTNGAFLLQEWDKPVSRVFVKNPLYVEVHDTYGGNLERISTLVVNDGGTIWSLYQSNQIDISDVPEAELAAIRQDEARRTELRQISDLAVFYFGFYYDKPPFDNVHVRRAFSAMLDRQTFVTEMLNGSGVPMAHFVPPGIFGAVPINEVGIGQPDSPGFDPDFARAELAKAGYPNCEGFPTITLLSTPRRTQWGEYMQNVVNTVLGCPRETLVLEQAEFTVLLKTISLSTPANERPHLYLINWLPDYPDSHNWLHDVLSCEIDSRPCSEEIDGRIAKAARESDPEVRRQLYREVEELLFGYEGEFPIMPLFLDIDIFAVKPWYTAFFETDGLFGGPHWESRRIDQAAQLAARGN
ncbi:MAG: peptide ABC transporter substrate-binding protein [Chloroflexi bacterium CFX4]|nr:peptide ABC transporter substrate-binding protein [Chloroflexi bacterium CFX4]MDL1923727.1 peptide ABC transporter substrate-binding protein [Chloroflexi bacterium CFX3]